jgi:hypothetical protein
MSADSTPQQPEAGSSYSRAPNADAAEPGPTIAPDNVRPAETPAPGRSAPGWSSVGWGLAIAVIILIGPFPTCLFKLAVGAPCPGCGLTRATLALLQLDFDASFHFHPLALVVSPLLGWVLGRPLLVRLGLVAEDRFLLSARASTWLVVVLVVALWVVYVARLAGALGGHPDPVVLSDGWLTRWWF